MQGILKKSEADCGIAQARGFSQEGFAHRCGFLQKLRGFDCVGKEILPSKG